MKRNETHTGIFILAVAAVMLAAGLHSSMFTSAHGGSDPGRSVVRVPEGIKPLDSPETFGPENLYEKINGQAELYLSAGFVRLHSQWFAETEDPDALFEIYIYHMGDGLNAFSVYSAQRREEAEKLDLTPFAYQTENALYLVHGPYHVEAISSAPSERLLLKMTGMVKHFIQDTPVDLKSIEGLSIFPKENLDQDSIAMIAKNAFGFDRLDRVFTAAYTLNGDQVTAFVSKRKTPREAEALSLAFQLYFKDFGGKEIKTDVAIKDVKLVEIMDSFEMIFSLGRYLAGIHEAPTKEQAEKLGEALAKRLEELSSGPGDR